MSSSPSTIPSERKRFDLIISLEDLLALNYYPSNIKELISRHKGKYKNPTFFANVDLSRVYIYSDPFWKVKDNGKEFTYGSSIGQLKEKISLPSNKVLMSEKFANFQYFVDYKATSGPGKSFFNHDGPTGDFMLQGAKFPVDKPMLTKHYALPY